MTHPHLFAKLELSYLISPAPTISFVSGSIKMRLLLVCLYEGVATRNVDVIVQRQGNAHWGISLLQVFLYEVDALHGALRARWQYSYLISRSSWR